MGHPVRTLIQPSAQSPDLPRGVPVEIAVSSLNDERGLRAAMVGVDTVYHLVSAERKGARASLMDIDIVGTRTVVQAASDAGVDRFFYVSHLGADRASAFPVLKAKAIAEEFIRRSGLSYTILRSAIVYGPNDGFTIGLASILRASPGIFLMPGDGNVLLQPLWVEDLVSCMAWALDDPETRNSMYEIGGPEYFTFRQVVEMVADKIEVERRIVPLPPPYLRALTVLLESIFPRLPISVYWLDYLAANRTTALDTIPRFFRLLPSRMSQRLAYLSDHDSQGSLLRRLSQRT